MSTGSDLWFAHQRCRVRARRRRADCVPRDRRRWCVGRCRAAVEWDGFDEAGFEDPVALRLVDGLAGLGRLVVFDRRGIGLSDPPADWDAPNIARWVVDLEAAAAEVGSGTSVKLVARS